MDPVEVISTGDGSHSLLNTVLKETYHSVHGAIQESLYVFIEQGLKYIEGKNSGKPVRILEVGFGTGLNAVLSKIHATQHKTNVYYESWEKFPLPTAIIQQLNYPAKVGDTRAFDEIHQASWNEPVQFQSEFTLYKRQRDVLTDPVESAFDIVFYDAFAPSKQPEMWSKDILKKFTDCLDPGGVLVTYCAKGQVKRDLASLGLIVETLAGPPGKKEMVRAKRSV